MKRERMIHLRRIKAIKRKRLQTDLGDTFGYQGKSKGSIKRENRSHERENFNITVTNMQTYFITNMNGYNDTKYWQLHRQKAKAEILIDNISGISVFAAFVKRTALRRIKNGTITKLQKYIWDPNVRSVQFLLESFERRERIDK
jgi:hypothetical protein